MFKYQVILSVSDPELLTTDPESNFGWIGFESATLQRSRNFPLGKLGMEVPSLRTLRTMKVYQNQMKILKSL